VLKFYQKIIDNKEYYFIIAISLLAGFYTLYNFLINDIALYHDPYYRFARAISYDKTGSFDLIESIPWTKPFDFLLYYCAKIYQFTFYLNFNLALLLSGATLCALCFGFSLFFIYENATYLNFSKVSKLFILISFILMPEIYNYFFPLRVDHHMFLLMLGILFWGLNLKVLENDRIDIHKYTIYSALVSALAIWVHIEFLVLVAVFEIFLYLNWCFINKKYKKVLLIYNLLMVVLLAIALTIENNGFNNIFVPVYDCLSIAQVSIFFVLSLNSIFLYLFDIKNTSYKFIFLIILAALDLLVFYNVFGTAFFNPYAGLDVYAVKNFFPLISEFQRFFRPLNSFVFVYLLLVAILLYSLIRQHSYKKLFKNNQMDFIENKSFNNFYLLSLFIVLSLLMFKNVRWSYYVYPILIFMVAPAIGVFIDNLDKRGLVFRFTASEFVYAFLVVNLIANLGLSYQYLIMVAIPKSIREDYRAKKNCHNDVQDYIKHDLVKDFGKDNNFTIMVDSDYGPLTLYETPYKVLSTNNHRNSKGMKIVKDFYDNKIEDKRLSKLVKEYNINVFITCKYQQFKAPSWLQHKKLEPKYKFINIYMLK